MSEMPTNPTTPLSRVCAAIDAGVFKDAKFRWESGYTSGIVYGEDGQYAVGPDQVNDLLAAVVALREDLATVKGERDEAIAAYNAIMAAIQLPPFSESNPYMGDAAATRAGSLNILSGYIEQHQKQACDAQEYLQTNQVGIGGRNVYGEVLADAKALRKLLAALEFTGDRLALALRADLATVKGERDALAGLAREVVKHRGAIVGNRSDVASRDAAIAMDKLTFIAAGGGAK